MTHNLLISVITPSFNSGSTIERAIASVAAQDYPHWEHIVIDGGSADSTVDTLKKYPRVEWISECDKGQADAMNKGFVRSRGDIIVYLNADDYFFPGAFSSVMAAFTAGAFFVVGNVLIKSPRLNAEFLNTPRITLEGMLRHWEPNAFCHNPVGYFYTRAVQETCPFNINNHATMDLEFLLDSAAHFPFTKVEYTLGCFEDGMTTKTHHTQVQFDYWQPKTFPYLDKHVDQLPTPQREQYLADRRAGYAQKQAESNWRAKQEGWTAEPTKKTHPSVSVIIPAYNCQAFVCRAIDSVLAQDIAPLEVLVINDCSSDDTEYVVKERYAAEPRVKVVRHAENKKQGASRNTGLSIATGDYIFFLDADDWIEPHALSTLRALAIQYDAEIVACGVRNVWSNGAKAPYHAHAFACEGGYEALWYLAEYYIGTIVWNKLYNRSFLVDNSLQFLENYWHEDVIFSMKAAANCKNYLSIDDVYINYYHNNESTTHTNPTPLHLASYLRMWPDIDNFGDELGLKRSMEGKKLLKTLLKNHASADMMPKLCRYLSLTSPEELDAHIEWACTNIFGSHGFAVADALGALLTYRENKSCSKPSYKILLRRLASCPSMRALYSSLPISIISKLERLKKRCFM